MGEGGGRRNKCGKSSIYGYIIPFVVSALDTLSQLMKISQMTQ